MVSSPSLLLQNSFSLSLSLSLWLNQHSTLSLSLFLSLFLFSPRKFVIRIGDSQCTFGSSDLCLLISFEIKGESALNLFRSLSNFFFLFVNFWIRDFLFGFLLSRTLWFIGNSKMRFDFLFGSRENGGKRKKKKTKHFNHCMYNLYVFD